MDVIVIDFGSEQWKVGWAGKAPTVLPSPAHAVNCGFISNWDAFRGGLLRVFALLGTKPEECSLLYVVPSKFPESSLHQLHHVSFEAGARSVRCVPSSPLVLCSEGAASGLVIDIGMSKTSLEAVCEGSVLDSVDTTKPVGCGIVLDKVAQLFREAHNTTITAAEAGSILRSHGYVAHSPTQLQDLLDKSRSGSLAPVLWKRQDEKVYDVSRIAPASCEALFDPEAGLGLGALVHNVVAKIFSTDFKRYSAIVSSVVLCGGLSDLPGLAERMKYELRPWPKLTVAPPTQRRSVFRAWHGGAQLASLPNYHSECTQRSAYSPMKVPVAAVQSPIAVVAPPSCAGPVSQSPRVRIEVPQLAALPAPVPPQAPDTPKTRELKELRAQQEAMRREMQEIKKSVEWDKLKTDSQFLTFKADMELATLRTGHEVAKTVRAAQEEAAAESRRQAREHVGLVQAVSAAKAGSTEDLQRIVQEMRLDAEKTRRQQAEREESLARAMRQQAALDNTEVRRMVDTVMQQAEETRQQQAESEERLLGVLQCLAKGSTSPGHASPARTAATPADTTRYLSPKRTPRGHAPRSASPVSPRHHSPSPLVSHMSQPAVPAPQVVWHNAQEASINPEIFASPPPPDSVKGSPVRSPLRGREGQSVWVHEGGKAEEGTLVGPYEGTNANLVGKDLWWVRMGGIKKLKPGQVIKADGMAAGVKQLIDFIDTDLSPKSLHKLKEMRKKLDQASRSNDVSPSFLYAKAPPPPMEAKQYENINPSRPLQHSPQDDKYTIPPVNFPTDSTHQDFPSAW